jgi:dienelactone hydrolase
MTELVLFHHAQGLTSGVRSLADELRSAGHTVHTPDLYEGRTFDSTDDGVAHARQIGFGTVAERGRAALESLPDRLVYAGISLGVICAQEGAQTRSGALGAVFFSGCFPPSEFETEWPEGVPLQIHMMERDEWLEEDLDAARSLTEGTKDAELFLYDGDRHLFIDPSTTDYDEKAASLAKDRVRTLLDAVG